jgi:PEP-CTERM motif
VSPRLGGGPIIGEMTGGIKFSTTFTNGSSFADGVSYDDDTNVFLASGGLFTSAGTTFPDFESFEFLSSHGFDSLNGTLNQSDFIGTGTSRMILQSGILFDASFFQGGVPAFGVSSEPTQFDWTQKVRLTYTYHVPEPNAAMALGAAGVLGILRRRRK